MKYFYLYFILSFLISLYGQNLKQMETKFLLLDDHISHQKRIIDSLTNQLDQQVSHIEQRREKGKAVNGLMADALSVSQEIKQKQAQLKELDHTFKTHIHMLDSVYTAMIDSLKQQSYKTGSDKEHIAEEIYLLTGKRFLLTPVFYALSFNPGKIQDINLHKARDAFETEVFSEYLKNADTQIAAYLQEIQKTREDVQQLSRLQKRTHEFLEDIQDDGSWAVLNNESAANEVYGGTDSQNEMDRTSKQFSVSSQFLNNYSDYQNLWIQLNNMTDPDINLQGEIKADSIPENLSLEDFNKLLEKLESKLKIYLSEIRQKLDSK